ncbi:MAG: tyrosine-type recombinase/integrase [Rhizobiaceae bacterium]
MTPWQLRYSGWRPACAFLWLGDCTIHTLRHTHAPRLVQNGLTIHEVNSVLGHADIRPTMRYAHLEQATVTRKARDIINALNTAPA